MFVPATIAQFSLQLCASFVCVGLMLNFKLVSYNDVLDSFFVSMGFMQNHFSDSEILDLPFVRVGFMLNCKPFF